ncbi:MAG: Asp-tRNA(Asn)/Glu-tRNA(Gln) amidotransferase GatCAB subunit A [Chloroflexi bacterium]|nr:MAG: Asp-tRNA(Asn)/Glu-tRNA(Gln) amidotransferase GatCAB subunit A [Chloroflexota bacterium]
MGVAETLVSKATVTDRPCFLSIAEAAKLIASRELSPVELTRSVLERIDETDARVHAYATRLDERALDSARNAEAAIGRGENAGPLHGIPIALKDLYYTAGIPTGAGSDVLSGFVPSHDATVTQLLRQAGAILVGKTVTHEFAYGQNVPPTRNPWDLERTPGGSSAGSGAAVAAHSCLAAMGTDTGGSIRMPASVDGVVGLKPTYGRVSRFGVVPLSWSLDHCGPITKTVEDAALIMNVIAGPDPRDPASASVAVDDATRSLREGVRGLRLGVPSNYFFDRIHRSVGSAVERALNVLEDMGAVRVAVEIPHVELSVPIGIGILMPEASAVHQSWIRQQPSRYDDGTRRMLEAGELVLATDYLRAQRARSVIKDEFKRTFQNHRLDALITPTEPTAATRIDQMSVDFGADELEPFFSVFVRQTIPFNVSGLPALSVPCGFSEDNEGGRIGVGLPIGLHIAGRPFDEATVLRIGFAYESATAWHTRRPPI